MNPTVQLETINSVLVITINRPEVRNAVNRETAQQLADAFREFDSNDNLQVAVLCGNGGNFCAGADLKSVSSGKPNRIEKEGDGPMGPSRMLTKKPVIAAIAGFAVAGGLELALLCDLRVVEEDATLGVFCRRFGVPLIDGGTVRLPAIVGLGRALDLILTGRAVTAKEALEMGLATQVVGKGNSKQAAIELAQKLAALPQECMLNDRLSVYSSVYSGIHPNEGLQSRLQTEFEYGLKSLASKDFTTGPRAFASGVGRHGTARL